MRELKRAEASQVAGGWFFCLRKRWSWSKCKTSYTKPTCQPTKPEPGPKEPPVFN